MLIAHQMFENNKQIDIAKSDFQQNNKLSTSHIGHKNLIEKARECHNHKPQPTSDTKRKRKKIEIKACKINKQIHKNHIGQLSPYNY